MIFATIFA